MAARRRETVNPQLTGTLVNIVPNEESRARCFVHVVGQRPHAGEDRCLIVLPRQALGYALPREDVRTISLCFDNDG